MSTWILLGLVVILLLAYLLFAIYQLLQFYYLLHPYKACLVSTNTRLVSPILSEVISDNVSDCRQVTFVELGAGKASISRAVAKCFDFGEVVAVEGDIFTMAQARFLNLFSKSKVKFVLEDIMKYQLKPNSVVYCYLFPRLMNKLFEMDYFKGSLLISLTFSLDGVEPTKVYKVKNFQKALYIYDFR